MSWYKTDKELWKNIIEIVATKIKRSVEMVEKDTIQSMFLFELSKSNLPYVFKGGTSLSKAYKLIARFSEDIDLSMSRKLSDNEKRAVKKEIIEVASKLGLVLNNINDIKSRYDYNKYVFKYNSIFDDEFEIIIETNFYQNVYPTNKVKIHSFVGDFCVDNSIILPVQYAAQEFEFNVQTLERTFVDKIFAVCDYKIQNMLERDSRHLYDIAKIYPLIKFDDSLMELIKLVRNDRSKSKNNPSADYKYDINDMLDEIIKSRFYEPDYNGLTVKLLYEPYDYDKAISNGIANVILKKVF